MVALVGGPITGDSKNISTLKNICQLLRPWLSKSCIHDEVVGVALLSTDEGTRAGNETEPGVIDIAVHPSRRKCLLGWSLKLRHDKGGGRSIRSVNEYLIPRFELAKREEHSGSRD